MQTLIPTGLEIPKLGEIWPGQGGRLINLHPLGGFLIQAEKLLDDDFEFGSYGVRLSGYSDIDGAENTKKLIGLGSPAAKAAAAYTADGHADFFLPAHRDLMLIGATQGLNPGGRIIWSSTPFGSSTAWALDFEDGDVFYWHRSSKFAVLPIRRFIP